MSASKDPEMERALALLSDIQKALAAGTKHYSIDGTPLTTVMQILEALQTDGAMTFEISSPADKTPVVEPTPMFVTTTHGMSGYFAVMMWYNTEDGPEGFWEPWQSGIGRYKTKGPAIAEAKAWAESEGLEYKESK